MTDTFQLPPPPVAGVSSGEHRPEWSVLIPTYNCADLLEPCLASVLAADPSDAEIVVVDDQSSDRPEDVVRRLGPDVVEFDRNEENLGAIGNFNSCIDRSRGHLVHLLHGDDMVEAGFYERATQVFHDHPDVGVFTGRVTYVDYDGKPMETTRSERSGSGVWDDALTVLTVSNRLRPPAIVVRREMYESLGGFRPDLPHAADWEMWVRLAAGTLIWFEDDVVARYRRHGESDTAARTLDGRNLAERLDAIPLLLGHLPDDQRRSQARRAYAYSAMFAGRTALDLVRSRHLKSALTQVVGAGRALGRAALASTSV